MSEDLIRRSDAIKALDANFTIKGKENMQTVLNYLELVRTRIESAPSIDIEPKRGEWIEVPFNEKIKYIVCSECGNEFATDVIIPLKVFTEKHQFCNRCGADMRGADDE